MIDSRGHAEAVEFVLSELLALLKEENPKKFNILKQNCIEYSNSTLVSFGDIGEYHLEQYAHAFSEKMENIFFENDEPLDFPP